MIQRVIVGFRHHATSSGAGELPTSHRPARPAQNARFTPTESGDTLSSRQLILGLFRQFNDCMVASWWPFYAWAGRRIRYLSH